MLATSQIVHETGQTALLEDLLPRWLKDVPLYQRPPWHPAGARPRASVLEVLGALPFITKQDIRRDFPRNFLPPGIELDDLLEQDAIELEHTSGTSQDRTPLLLPRHWWGLQEARALRLNREVARILDENPDVRRVTISSPVCSGEICYTGVPARSERTLGHSLYVSLSRFPFLWGESDLARIAEETRDWNPAFIECDPVYGVVFALYCERKGIRLPGLRFMICSYEFLSVAHRRILHRVFNVPVLNLYGSTETGHLMMEDEHGQMRPSPGTALLEVLDLDAAGIGQLVVTTLTNQYMPLIRYRIGDLVRREVMDGATRYILHGRAADAFHTPSGRCVTTWQIDQLFADAPGIAHYQLVQRGPADWTLRLIPDLAGPAPGALNTLCSRIRELVESPSPVVAQPTDMLVPEGSGKFRLGYPAARG
jgi:phenylacetate-CoA ligase